MRSDLVDLIVGLFVEGVERLTWTLLLGALFWYVPSWHFWSAVENLFFAPKRACVRPYGFSGYGQKYRQ
eukprot:6632526-Prymnesium_polylepis.1